MGSSHDSHDSEIYDGIEVLGKEVEYFAATVRVTMSSDSRNEPIPKRKRLNLLSTCAQQKPPTLRCFSCTHMDNKNQTTTRTQPTSCST